MKFLLWLALALLVVWLWRSAGRRAAGRTAPPAENVALGGEPMRRCQHCGLHLPQSEAVFEGDAAFCSEEHRRLHQTSA